MTGAKKVVVVTGGAQGIGKGIAQKLLAAGQAVVLADLDREAGEETLAEFAPLGTVRFIRTDVSDEGSAENCINLCGAEFGRIDALVNNAGIARSAQLTAGVFVPGGLEPGNQHQPHRLFPHGQVCHTIPAQGQGEHRQYRLYQGPAVRARHRGLFSIQGRPSLIYPCTGNKPGARGAGELHQPGLDRCFRVAEERCKKNSPAVRGRPRPAPGRQGGTAG